jgi:hypothetical protein
MAVPSFVVIVPILRSPEADVVGESARAGIAVSAEAAALAAMNWRRCNLVKVPVMPVSLGVRRKWLQAARRDTPERVCPRPDFGCVETTAEYGIHAKYRRKALRRGHTFA